MDHDSDVGTVNRRSASSGRVSYGDPVVLHETTRSRITFVPFFIPHSDYTELSIKISTWDAVGHLWDAVGHPLVLCTKVSRSYSPVVRSSDEVNCWHINRTSITPAEDDFVSLRRTEGHNGLTTVCCA
jgi:hypothetical protein